MIGDGFLVDLGAVARMGIKSVLGEDQGGARHHPVSYDLGDNRCGGQ